MSLNDDQQELIALHKKFADNIKLKRELLNSIDKETKNITKVNIHKSSLLELLCLYNNKDIYKPCDISEPHNVKPCTVTRTFPIFVKDKQHVLAIYNFGELPTKAMRSFYNDKFVYPINFKSKRIYYKHRNAIGDRSGYMFYSCMIQNVKGSLIFEIVADDGNFTLNGSFHIFERFKQGFGFEVEFSSIEDLFGLNDATVISYLAKMEGFVELKSSTML